MSLHHQKVRTIGNRVTQLLALEKRELRRWMRALHGTQRWFWMLYHEFLRDDVKIRAQSLSFLMIFSLLPLIAGAFFIFTFLAQFGMVQDAITGMVENLLSGVPAVHRQILDEYILRFKDAYLAQLTHTSGSVGIFALLILVWVGLQTFNNVDATLNFVWSADRSRPFYEKVRNFIVVAVVAPIVLTGGFSVPLILRRLPVTHYFFLKFPILGVLLNYVIPSLLVLGIFLMLYRYVPVRRVWWTSAFYGAAFATVALAITNLLMRFYFAFGTNSAYGKAAVIPLVGFWIYALWIVVILGSEVSFLVQNGRDIFVTAEREPTLREGRGLIWILVTLYQAYSRGAGPVTFEKLRDEAKEEGMKVRAALQYLLKTKWIVECADDRQNSDAYTLARDVSALPLSDLLGDYFAPSAAGSSQIVDKEWRKSIEEWVSYFDKTHVTDLAK